jgi:tetratricopeptide (TPR) repeat protein
MEYISPWPLLRAGKSEQEQGLRLVQQAYTGQPFFASAAMTLGVALLWLGRYAEAWEHFNSVIETAPRVGDSYYGMAGVAKWCLGRPDEAVSEWRAGLKAKYARASGLGVRMPLLLFFAAIREPRVFDRRLAEKLLSETTKDIRIGNWPAPIARLVLDQISEAEFDNHCRGIKPGITEKNPFVRHSPQETSNCLWLAEFYRSVLVLEQGTLSDFQDSMRKLSDTSQPEWQDEKYVFTARIWCEEFFLARYEAATFKP